MDQAVEQPTLVQMEPPDFQEAWQMVASQLRMEMKRTDYETWVQALKPLSYKEGVYRLGATNSYARDWVESRLRARIGRLLESIFHQEVTVHFSLLKGGAGGSAPRSKKCGPAAGGDRAGGSGGKRCRERGDRGGCRKRGDCG